MFFCIQCEHGLRTVEFSVLDLEDAFACGRRAADGMHVFVADVIHPELCVG